MIMNVHQACRTFAKLEDGFLFAEDEDGNEYVIDCIRRHPIHEDDSLGFYYTLKIRKSSGGYIPR